MPADRRAFVGMTISVAAGRVGMHPQTLREYERQGLVTPSRTPGGARRYQEAQLARLERIQQLTAEGVSLAGVRYILGLEDRVRELTAHCEQLEHELTGRDPQRRHSKARADHLPIRQSMSLEIVHVPRPRRGPRWRNG